MKPVLILIASVLWLAACAGEPPKSAEAEEQSRCVRETGSRIPNEGRCEPGRSYSRDEIERTGQMSTGEALRTLDPAVRR